MGTMETSRSMEFLQNARLSRLPYAEIVGSLTLKAIQRAHDARIAGLEKVFAKDEEIGNVRVRTVTPEQYGRMVAARIPKPIVRKKH